jgi:hypothetical protein
MEHKNGVTKVNCGFSFVVILRVFYISGFTPALLMLPALLACFVLPISASVLMEEDCPPTDPDYAVLLPHPTDCSRFFRCSNGVPYEEHCPGVLHFNVQLNVCDWPENARCMKRKLCRLCVTLDLLYFSINDSLY